MPAPASHGELQVRLVAPRVWQPQVAEAFGSLAGRGPHAVRLAETILWTLHNRHVGITPWLVSQLVPYLLEPRTGSRAPSGLAGERGWQIVVRRLVQEISPPTRDGVPAAQYHGGIALGASQTYTLLKVLTPLILAACTEIGQTCLFAGDGAGTSVSAEQYVMYMQQLATAILQRASKVPAPDHETGELARDPFWYEPASTLSGLVRGGAGRSQTLPAADPVELGLLLRLRPRITDSSWARKRKLSMPTSPTQGRRRREEGYVGIHITHRDEDLPAMLLSEMLMPKLVRLDRLLNSGFFALERRPRRQKLHDVLVIGMLPPALAGRAGGDFVKASWVDCQLRLSTLLRQHKLLKSELRWIEGDAFDRFRSCRFRLDDIPVSDPADAAVEMNQGRREGLLNAMRWLPGYVDARAHFSASGQPTAEEDADAERDARGDNGESADRHDDLLLEPAGRSILPDWVFSSWRAQQPRGRTVEYTTRITGEPGNRPAARSGSRPSQVGRRSQRGSQSSPDDAPIDSFSYVHVMLMLPASLRPAEGSGLDSAGAVLTELRGRLGMGARPDRHVSITWVPDNLESARDWRVDTRRRIGQTLVDDDEADSDTLDTLDENELAGRLVTTWLLQITQELTSG